MFLSLSLTSFTFRQSRTTLKGQYWRQHPLSDFMVSHIPSVWNCRLDSMSSQGYNIWHAFVSVFPKWMSFKYMCNYSTLFPCLTRRDYFLSGMYLAIPLLPFPCWIRVPHFDAIEVSFLLIHSLLPMWISHLMSSQPKLVFLLMLNILMIKDHITSSLTICWDNIT